MDKNQIIGIVLIFTLFIAWQQFFAPTPEELQAEQARLDSIAQVDAQLQDEPVASLATPTDTLAAAAGTPIAATSDSLLLLQRAGSYGAFAQATLGEAGTQVLENDLMQITVNTKGGQIIEVLLKDYKKIIQDSNFQESKIPLKLLDDPKNKFEYLLPVSGVPNGIVRTSELIFTPTLSGNTLSLRAMAGPEQYVEQVYTIKDGSYLLDYDFKLVGLQQVLANNAEQIELSWINYLDKIEINDNYERNYTTVYFKPAEDDVDRCSCTSSDEETTGQPIKWVSAANQFFNTTIFAKDRFSGITVRTEMLDEDARDLKKIEANIQLPYGHSPNEQVAMQLYLGPNEFEPMRAIGQDFTDVIPYGRSIFGAINRWVIRPVFNFFDGITGNKGIAIILLTLLVKLLVFPLTYKMLHSQSKMQAMKPYLEKVKAKHKDDQQAQQMETMKMYREYGVNPLGGCLPMALQMPIWFALYRFFPADIAFRQEPFLWATDLSSYDVIMRLPFEVPLGFGAHISLFAVLWAITTLIYTFYNTKHMDFGANPFMKYFQYLMPLMFLGFFNSFAAGLTAYLFFSNLFNITQTVVTKNFIIDQDKIREELEANKRKPKKKGGFQERLQSALAEQQKRQAELEAKRKKK